MNVSKFAGNKIFLIQAESPTVAPLEESDVANASLLTVSDMNNSGGLDQAVEVISQKQPIFDDLFDAPVADARPSSSDTSFIAAMSDLGIGANSGDEAVAEDLAAKLDAIAEESKSSNQIVYFKISETKLKSFSLWSLQFRKISIYSVYYFVQSRIRSLKASSCRLP